MPNSEGKKSPIGQVKPTQMHKRKPEYAEMGTVGVESIKSSESAQGEKYRMLIQNIPCAVYSAYPGKAGPTTFMSNKWKDWTGYSPEELYHDPEAWPKCIHPDDREEAVNTYTGACLGNVPYNLEYRIVHKETGQVRYVRDRGLLSKDQKETIIRVNGIITDISECKQAENTLRKSEERFQIMLENLPNVAVQGYGPDGTIHYWNKANELIYGYTAEEAIGKDLVELIIPPEMRDYVREAITHGACTGEMPPAAELNLMCKDGSRVPVWSSHAVVRRVGKEPELYCIDVDLRELKRTEKALQESQEQFKNVFNNALVGLYRTTPDGRILMANPALVRMLGYDSFEELAKRNLEEGGFEPQYFRSDFKERVEVKGRVIGLETDWTRRDGTILSVRESARAIRDEHGNILYYEGTVEDITERKRMEEELRRHRDHLEEMVTERTHELERSNEMLHAEITERKQTEEALRESEEKFRSLAEQSPNMIFINKKGKVVYANKKCEEVMGYTREELCSDDFDFRTLIAPESLGLVNDNYAKYLRCEGVTPYDYCLINKKGERIEAINTIKLIQYEGETAILGVVTDITERKKAEQALRESEERLKILFESAPDAIYLIDSEGRFVDSNKAALELIGFAKDEVIGKSLAELGLLSAGQLSKAEGNLKKVATGKLSGPDEYILKRKDGAHVSVEVRTFPVKIEGEILTLGIARDITEHKLTEKKLLEHQAKLKSLASQLSLTEERERHRLATELHDQIGQSLVISKIKLDQLHKSSTSDEFSRPLEDICNCLGQIIDDTRTLTFDLSYPILYELGFEAAVAEWLTDQIQEKHGIKTEFVDDGHQQPLDDDIRVLLFRNVRELLINVIKHAQANHVKVSIRKVKDNICVSVEDDGVGFDPVEVTSMAAKRAEFGLFSIRERLEQLGGLIEIDSRTGRGSKITMTAPLKYDNSTDRTQQ